MIKIDIRAFWLYLTTMCASRSNHHNELLFLICETAKAVRCCQQEEIFCEDVTFSQFLILDAVCKAGKLPLSDLHGILAVEKSTTTRMVEPLVLRGFVVREKARRDSRAVNLKLTKEGRIVCDKVWLCLRACLNAIENRIPEAQRQQVYDSVRTFTNAVQQICGNRRCEGVGHSSLCAAGNVVPDGRALQHRLDED